MVVNDQSPTAPQFSINAQNIPDDSVDCGIRRLRWCQGQKCLEYARLRTFVIVLATTGLVQGACESYFRISAKEAAAEYGYDPLIVEWLLVSSGIFQALLALFVAHWAHKLHPITWLGGIIILQASVCIIAVIPEIINFSEGQTPVAPANLPTTCVTTLIELQRSTLSPEQSRIFTLVLLFVLQFALGMGSLAYYTIGIVYVDDNSQSIDSPAVIATTLGAKLTGLQLGSFLVMGVEALSLGWWLGWAILGPLVFTCGILLGLFPKRLPETVIHQTAQRILEENNNRNFGSHFFTYIDNPHLCPSLRRLFGNKLLMFNILSLMFIQSAYINFGLQEENYLQSRFYLPFSEEDGLVQEWNARFVSYFLRPPVAGLSMLTMGLLIAKLKLSGRQITFINIVLGVLLLGIFVANVFIDCRVGSIAGISNGKLTQTYCSRQCICEPNIFQPVCPENSTVTYFSPCYAGCTMKTNINSVQLYEGCTCGSYPDTHSPVGLRATEGACSADTCFRMLVAFQILSLCSASMLGVTLIGKVIITLRSVLPQDKGLALGFELLIIGFFAYIPAHLSYSLVTRSYCSYWAPGFSKCLLRETPIHGNVLNILSASLVLCGIIFDILVFIFIEGLNIYHCKVTDVDYTPSLYSPVPRDDFIATPPDVDFSPVTTMTNMAPIQSRNSTPIRPAPSPKSEITVFRNPSSLTQSSVGENSVENVPGVTYAQVVFPPDRHKRNDGTTSPKRMAVRADVPLQHLSSEDVRTQLGNLRSFGPQTRDSRPLTLNTGVANGQNFRETDLDVARPLSPETDF